MNPFYFVAWYDATPSVEVSFGMMACVFFFTAILLGGGVVTTVDVVVVLYVTDVLPHALLENSDRIINFAILQFYNSAVHESSSHDIWGNKVIRHLNRMMTLYTTNNYQIII